MKKLFLISTLLLCCSCFAYEEIIALPEGVNFDVSYEENSENLIDTQSMKKSKTVEEAEAKAKENQRPKFVFDKKQINQQRALDYMTKHNNSMLPTF